MNARQIEAFRAIARTGTVTSAAHALHISQPAVSRLLAHLELQLRLKLFNRTQGRLKLTPEGAALLQEVDRHFIGLDAIADAARRIAEHGPGNLRILAFPSMSSGELPAAVAALLARHPATSITIDTDTTDRIAARVESGAYDVGFTAGVSAHDLAVESEIIAERPWTCIFPQDHPLRHRTTVSMEDLRDEILVGFSPGMSLRNHVDQLFAVSGIQPEFALAAQTIESICSLVRLRCGVAIIHPYATHVAQLRNLSTAHLEHPARLGLVAVKAPPERRAAFVDDFVDSIRSQLEMRVRPENSLERMGDTE